ncbi:hypothetical protein [Streptomyces resistomycificus]|uniref:Uncharacterized protein n=1 Tax=Streptomyces resistomycificus TaxID=67356 RepID=A0A0L8L1N9_9ACTN|nr:hypothetical protein [Streptomyces resistomycificus]KOG32087.1 hypothetical protein ADK37_28680 [Streptomyces resistomycificus]KUN93879.1 hypothetical protein AQJ84_28550 [Streptomyces resistomycificus]
MSRTVHHVPSRHRDNPAWSRELPGPRTGHALVELRYSRAESADAVRAGRRPLPTQVVRRFAAYTYPRALNEQFSSPYESRARAALQAFRTTARNHLRAAPEGALLAAAEELDHPPTRHRHRDLWEA